MLELRAWMARNGLAPNQLAPYEDPERGFLDPKDDPETKAALWLLARKVWDREIEEGR
jgi:hypothetical protein